MSLLREWGELGPIYGKQWRNWDVTRLMVLVQLINIDQI